MHSQLPLNTWQSGVVWLFSNPEFLAELALVIEELCDPGRDASILVGAFCNYFSMKNPDFGPNYWAFPKKRCQLLVDYSGVYISGDDELACRRYNVRIAKSAGRDLWVRTFLSPFPRNSKIDS